MPPSSPLVKYLTRLGYGTRRDVERLLADRRVTGPDGAPLQAESAWTHDTLRVDEEPLDPPPGTLIVMHKPVDVVTSSRDSNPVVYGLLPPRFLRRDPVIAPVGRLDRDTSGVLLFTDDGALNHRLTSPKHHLPRTYEVELAEPLRGDEGVAFASGALQLEGERTPLLPASLEATGERSARVTLTEGRYHQVRRMFAAVGNHVVRLHRSSFGPIVLDGLEPGAWRVLDAVERASLDAALQAARGARG